MQPLTEVSEVEHAAGLSMVPGVVRNSVPLLTGTSSLGVSPPASPPPHSPFSLLCPCRLTNHSNFFPFEISMERQGGKTQRKTKNTKVH